MPVVHRPVAEQHREAELTAGFARSDFARRPIHGPYFVSPNMTAEFGTEGWASGIAHPLSFKYCREKASRIADIRDQIPDLVRGRRYVNCRRTFHGPIQTHAWA